MKRRKQSGKSRREKYEQFDDEAYINEVLYKEGYRPPERKKKKRKGVFLGLLTFLLGIAIIIFAFLLLFHIQKIEVKGNQYTAENDVIEWFRKDKYAMNSVYAWWKYNKTDVKQLPAVESSRITMKAPWSIRVTVKEKEITGYIDYNNQYLYFDKDGTALLTTKEKVEGAAYIEGMDIDASKVELGKVLPVSDKNVFQRIVEISQLLVKYELNPDRITCSGSELNLYFGKVEVLLGKTNYEERLAQVSPILEKLAEKYPDKEGTLHLENFDVSDKAIRFVPKTAEDQAEGKEGEDNGNSEGSQDGQDGQGQEDGDNGEDGTGGPGTGQQDSLPQDTDQQGVEDGSSDT